MTENKGDLISRSELLKTFSNSKHIKETTSGLDVMKMLAIKEVIDNAPTVEPRIEYGTDGQPYRLFMSSAERPQGEWEESHIFSCGKILRMQLDVIEHKCKHCGRWSIKWVGTIPDNFCSYCGASIKEVKKND